VEANADQAPREAPGRVLAAERERQGLGPADIAQRLHMSVWQVEALEAGDYSKLPRGPFLRGFVRNYAKAVGLVPDQVLALLAEGAPREQAPRIVVPTQNIHFEGGRIPPHYVRATAVAGVLLVFGFAAMYWWLFIRTAPPMSARKTTPAAVAEGQSAGVAPAPDKGARVQAPAGVRSPPPMVAEAPKPLPEPTKAEPPKPDPPRAEPPKLELAKSAPPAPKLERVAATGSGGTLKFRFAGQSWVEIRDAGGKVIMTGLNDPGSEAEVVGKPPFRVVVGNAPGVRMYYNDREFNLEPHMREAVARLTVE